METKKPNFGIILIWVIILTWIIFYLLKGNLAPNSFNWINISKTESNKDAIKEELANKKYLAGFYKMFMSGSSNGFLSESQYNFIKEISKSDNKLTTSRNWWMELVDYEKLISSYTWEKNKFNVELRIFEYKSKKPISSWIIYINWIKTWIFKAWIFSSTIEWPVWLEMFNIVVRSDNYWDWFYNLNALKTKWTLLFWEIILQKSESKEVILSKDQKVNFSNFSIKIPECSFVNNKWECIKSKVKIDTNFIPWNIVNNWGLSLGWMRAVDSNWEIVYLTSWWMAFIKVIDSNWEYLQVAEWKTVIVSYKVTKEDIKTMAKLKNMYFWRDEWYWYFDKNTLLWEKREAKVYLDEINMLWSAEVDAIY